ncbi:hypothetical protein OV079_49245 [Nannocystis pusilla]|uniref:Uncharacterized protein n=1 Tax=Nannocystis pusilla TaxID=889268 RepID=A0A9X3F8H2_9BACT|nr:hypothetical protein [Nannocystis pusilla]MCY1013386.1 hypothetical protein [Nannocystis pusilla]
MFSATLSTNAAAVAPLPVKVRKRSDSERSSRWVRLGDVKGLNVVAGDDEHARQVAFDECADDEFEFGEGGLHDDLS